MLLGALLCSCTNVNQKEFDRINQERDSLMSIVDQKMNNMNKQITNFLTFQENNAEEAMNFYINLFDNSKVVDIQRYKENEPGKEGTVKIGRFQLDGIPFMCSDSYIKHDWSFTPAISLYLELDSEERIAKLFEQLSEGGKIMMPLNDYGFSKKFAFVEDRFGVSWQLNLN